MSTTESPSRRRMSVSALFAMSARALRIVWFVPELLVHRLPGHRVLQLQEPAPAADHQLQRRPGPVRISRRYEVGDVMFAQVQDGLQRAFADTASRSGDHLVTSSC